MGIPAYKVGRGCREVWGQGTARLLRPDELVVQECIRRSLGLHMKYVELMRWGHLMQSTGKPKSKMRRLGGSQVEEEGRQ